MQYNKKKHLDLLKYSQKLESEEKHIYDESEISFFALREYSAILINHLHWENREHYFELIEEFLNEPINFLPLKKKTSICQRGRKKLTRRTNSFGA